MTGFVLIIYLSTMPGYFRVELMPDLLTCLLRAQFEERFNPRAMPICVPHTGGVA